MTKVDKIDNWLRTMFPKRRWSKGEIESYLLRGPLKDVIAEFLVPECRSSEEIEVMRSILYVHGMQDEAPQGLSEQGELEKELEELRRRKKLMLEKVQEKARVRQEEMNDGDVKMAQVWDKTCQLRKIQTTVSCVKEIVQGIAPLVDEENNDAVTLDWKASLESVHQDAGKLFRQTFFPFGEDKDKDGIKEGGEELERKCEDIVKRGIPERSMTAWVSSKISDERNALQALKQRTGSSYMEEWVDDVRKRELDLCREHVTLHMRNLKLKEEISTARSTKQNCRGRIVDLMQNNPSNIKLSYELKRVREAELKASINCRKELLSKLAIENSGCKDEFTESGSELLDCQELESLLSSVLRSYPLSMSNFASVKDTCTFADIEAKLKAKHT